MNILLAAFGRKGMPLVAFGHKGQLMRAGWKSTPPSSTAEGRQYMAAPHHSRRAAGMHLYRADAVQPHVQVAQGPPTSPVQYGSPQDSSAPNHSKKGIRVAMQDTPRKKQHGGWCMIKGRGRLP